MAWGTTEAARRVELPWLRQQGYFPKGGSHLSGSINWSRYGESTGSISVAVDTMSSAPHIRMEYKLETPMGSGEWKLRDYKFPLERLPCRFGGFKWFVRCQLSTNGVFCGKRVRVLYMVNGYFGCRHCARLTYDSCRQGGRYKGFVCIPDLDEMEAKVKRKYYAGKPTKKYRRLLKMEENFEFSFVKHALWSKGIR